MSNDTVNIPLVHVLIDRIGQTTSVAEVPEYESRLIREIWAGAIRANKAKVTVKPMPEGAQKYRVSDFDTEMGRMSSQYAINPTNKSDMLFNRVFPGMSFDEAFERAIGNAAPSIKVPDAPAQADELPEDEEPKSASLLIPVKGVNTALAELIEEELGIYTIEELAEVDEQSLVDLNGVGPKTAKAIIASAQELALQGADSAGE